MASDAIERVWGRLPSGARQVLETGLSATDLGDRHGQLEDPFGHRWNIAQHLRDVPHDEVVAAAGRAFTS